MTPADRITALLKEPPKHIVELAVEVAGWSSCRSKRGVVIFDGENVVSHGHNYKPRGFECDGSDACKATCRVEAIHAEQQAVINAAGRPATSGADLVHVKAVDGALVPSGGPSCVQCSKHLVAAGIAGVWLYHGDGWRRYQVAEFHRLSLTSLQEAGTPSSEQDTNVEKFAGTFAMEFMTGHYRELRDDERPRYEQLRVVMLAFAALIRRQKPPVESQEAGTQEPDEIARLTVGALDLVCQAVVSVERRHAIRLLTEIRDKQNAQSSYGKGIIQGCLSKIIEQLLTGYQFEEINETAQHAFDLTLSRAEQAKAEVARLTALVGTPEQDEKMCAAGEWHRDGRGLWAKRWCQYYRGHGKAHSYSPWCYNVQPPALVGTPAPSGWEPTPRGSCGFLMCPCPFP